MSPRTRQSRGPIQPPTPHHPRTSRKPSFGQHSSSPDQRTRVAGPKKTPKSSITTRGQRRVRASSGPQNPNSSEEDGGHGGAGRTNEEDDNSDNVDEPEAFAPSGPITRKRGHQTGLSVTLSKTNLGSVQAGTKRELSVSTVDSETRGRPRKMSKLGQRPSMKQAKQPEEDPAAWDSDYGAVDDISESEQGLSDSDWERREEQQIIQSIEHETDIRSKRGRSVDSWADFRFDTPPVDDESRFFSEHFALTEASGEHEAPGGRTTRHGRTPTSDPAPVRRVRFADIESSTSTSTTSSRNSERDDFAFPDLLFEDQDHQAARAVVSLVSPEEDPGQYSDGSYWELDVSEPIGAIKTKMQRARTPHPRSSSDSSGYETDTSEGETTDEDPIPPQTVNRPQANLRLITDSSATKRIFRKNAIPRPQSQPRRGKGPCLGTWIADPAKPIGIVDHKTKKMFYVKPAPPLPKPDSDYKDDESSPVPNNGNTALEDVSDSSAQNGELSMQAQGTDVMFSGFMSDIAAGDTPSAGIMGPPEAFFSFEEFEFETQDDDEDPENQLDITDFIDFGDGSSDSNDEVENEPDSEELASPVTPLSSQKLPTIRPKQSKDRTSSQSLLSHFDKGIVSAFRRNQHRHQSVLRRPAIGSKSLAIKGGRHQAASSPISPARKRRADSGLDQSVSLFTGLNGTRMRTGTL